ncbi:MAG: methionine ABC transporter permease [Filifactor alocis]|nr:methionine ABC transporter permease [Filifactor alocis]
MLSQYFPNMAELYPELLKSLWETFFMIGISGFFSTLIGIPLGVVMLITSKGHILENSFVYSTLSKVVNAVRSVPAIILFAALTGITRMVMGTSIGLKGSLFPLTIACIPFLAKQVELALYSVDLGVIEAYTAMGFSPLQIVIKVILREGLGGIINAITVSLISLLSFSAIAGSIGSGGLGYFAIRYGYQGFKQDAMIVTVVVILLIVYLLQGIGDFLARKVTH